MRPAARTSTPEDTSGPWLVPSAPIPRCSSSNTTRARSGEPPGSLTASSVRPGPAVAKEEFGPDGYASPEELGAQGTISGRRSSDPAGPARSGRRSSEAGWVRRGPDELGARRTPARSPCRRRFQVGSPRRTIWKPARSPRRRRASSAARGSSGHRMRARHRKRPRRPTECITTEPDGNVRRRIMASRPAPAPERRVPPWRGRARPAAGGAGSGPASRTGSWWPPWCWRWRSSSGLAYLLVAGTRSAPQAGAAAATRPRPPGGDKLALPGAPELFARRDPSQRLAGHAHPGPCGGLRSRGGPAHGDNPQNAALAIDRRPGRPGKRTGTPPAISAT